MPPRLEPGEECSSRRVSKTNPHDLRSLPAVGGPHGEIAILGDDDPTVTARESPDGVIRRIHAKKFPNVIGRMVTLAQPIDECGGQLCVDDKLHAAITVVSPMLATA